MADQWVMHFRYQNGQVAWVGSRLVHLPQPRTTPRVTGRWALELLSGPTLVERVRFDFPGLGADELAGQQAARDHSPPRFERRAVVDYQVMVPDSSRFSRARLVDRATGKIMVLPWPARCSARRRRGGCCRGRAASIERIRAPSACASARRRSTRAERHGAPLATGEYPAYDDDL